MGNIFIEIIKEPTQITCSTSLLLEHILANFNYSQKISREGMIDVWTSGHQLMYCARKIKRIKHNMHNQIQVWSLEKYSVEIFTNALKIVQMILFTDISQVLGIFFPLIHVYLI